MAVRIGLIHSVLPAITAVESMFEKHWPEAQRASIYDQSLYIDLNSDRTMPPKVMLRAKSERPHLSYLSSPLTRRLRVYSEALKA